MDLPTAATIALDQPLPPELTGRGHGWLTRYRRYPVFSPPWARLRLRSLGLVVLLAFALAFGGAVWAAHGTVPWGALAQLTIALGVPLLAGPWLASLVRRRSLAPRQEWIGLLAAVLGVVAAVVAFNEWLSEPLKQQVAQWAGQVDATGQRKRVALTIGVQIRSPDSAVPGPPSAEEHGTRPNAATHVTTAFAAFCLAGGFALPRWRREREGLAALARERELARAQAERHEAELRLSVLAAQVEPHFLFNTLAGVRSAIATDPGRASEMIDRLVDYLRASIPRLRGDGVEQATLGAQLDIVRAYLSLMAARMPRLKFAVDAPRGLLGAPCPPLMLISLAENAVKHGIEPKIGPARIDVSVRRADDGRLEITVADDGAGFGASISGDGLGLANIRERLQQMYRGRAELTLKARPEGGVAATLALPTD